MSERSPEMPTMAAVSAAHQAVIVGAAAGQAQLTSSRSKISASSFCGSRIELRLSHVQRRASLARHTTCMKISEDENVAEAEGFGRRQVLTAGTGLAFTLANGSFSLPAAAADSAISEWEKVPLPIDPGVVLLDIAFVPGDANHGESFDVASRHT